METKKKQIKICGVRQNIYALDTLTDTRDLNRIKQKTYASLEKKDLPTGFVQVLVEKDYPINSESVSSYADGADYRRDPLTAISQAPKRVNLGDVSEVQKFMRDNPMEAARQYKDILDKVKVFTEAQALNDTANSGTDITDKGEVK